MEIPREEQRGLPETFSPDGLLPAGDYLLTLEELANSMLVHGPLNAANDNPNWDSKWRAKLVKNLEILVEQLRNVRVTEIFIDGSFVEDKAHPNDIDGYFECDLDYYISGDLQRDLNLEDPYKVWTWNENSRSPYRGYRKSQLPMWHIYRVELYPHYGQVCGITDRHGFELKFPSAFRHTREDTVKGIVKIKV